MSHRYFSAVAVLLLFASMSSGQADQAASAEKQKTANAQAKDAPQKENAGDAIAALMGGARIDKEAAERGRKIFVPACGFCHGNDAHGKSGPDLVRSALVLHDNKGDVIGPVIRNGRLERGMPAFSAFSQEQIADISTFLHSRAADVSNRFAYKIGDLITGDAQKGAAFFNGEGHCGTCHSATGDLAHMATKYEPVELQRRMLYPAPNLIDVFLGRAVAPPAPTKVTVQLLSGERVSGTLDHLDEFTVSMHDSAGWYRSFSRENVIVDIQDPRAAHEGLLPTYSDQQMHDVLAYLETLK
ncbi:MAG TPA: c-type cytochrome [Candidatus Acidoferrum sp.]